MLQLLCKILSLKNRMHPGGNKKED
jgi:hypothetical protein